MQLGLVGLGRMGANIARRLMRAQHECVVFDRDPAPGIALTAEGASNAPDLAALVAKLTAPRTVWIMLPSGEITERAIAEVAALLSPGDTIIDGGNTNWKDDIRRAAALRAQKIHYLDVGTSGGVWGLERGYCMMIGGDKAEVDRLDSVFAALAPGRGDVPVTHHRDGRDRRVE
jgi:6-phosphogluconate dehydrogenase